MKSWLNQETIESLSTSVQFLPEKLKEPVDSLVTETYHFYDETERCIDNVTDHLQDMNDIIKSDIAAANLVERNLNNFDDADKLAQGCPKIDEIEGELKRFASDVEKDVQNFKSAVFPELENIIAGLESLSTKYNGNRDDIDIETDLKVIEDLKVLVLSETAATQDRLGSSIDALESATKLKGENCENYMKQISEFYQALAWSFQNFPEYLLWWCTFWYFENTTY